MSAHMSKLASEFLWHEPLGECVYLENTSDAWDIPWYTMRKRCITGMYPRMLQDRKTAAETPVAL